MEIAPRHLVWDLGAESWHKLTSDIQIVVRDPSYH